MQIARYAWGRGSGIGFLFQCMQTSRITDGVVAYFFSVANCNLHDANTAGKNRVAQGVEGCADGLSVMACTVELAGRAPTGQG